MMMMFLRGALPLCVMVLGTSCKQASSADETPSPPEALLATSCTAR